MATLQIQDPLRGLLCVRWSQDEYRLGRAADCDLQLPDPQISRYQARIQLRGKDYWLVPEGRASMWLNDQPVSQPCILKGGDVLRMSSLVLHFEPNDNSVEDLNSDTQLVAINERIGRRQRTDPKQHVCLRVDQTGQPRREETFKRRRLLIGTAPDCDVYVASSEVAAYHVQLDPLPQGWKVSRLNPNYEVYLEDVSVHSALWHPTQNLRLGDCRFQIVSHSPLVSSPHQKLGLIITSSVMQKFMMQLEKAGPTEWNVLIQGESGVGKELVAKALHQLSARRDGPFVTINCGAISPSLIESELFGHEKGSFTGAVGRHEGAFEQAQGGTLFLDEIGELPLDLQPKILRALENRVARRVGGTEDIPLNIRVVAATHRPLEVWAGMGKFREDLFYRLSVLTLRIPSLRERREDIPYLIRALLDQAEASDTDLTSEALVKLQAYSWPGNVRQLKNILLRTLVYTESKLVAAEDIELPADVAPASPQAAVTLGVASPSSAMMNLNDIEKTKIEEALRLCGGNKRMASELLGIAKSTLFKKIRDYQLGPQDPST